MRVKCRVTYIIDVWLPDVCRWDYKNYPLNDDNLKIVVNFIVFGVSV